MLDKFLISNKYELITNKDDVDINIKYFSDVHHNETFNEKKLDKIYEKIFATPTDYICIGGDIIDSTNHIKSNITKRKNILKFLEEIAKSHKTFISLGNHDSFKRIEGGWEKEWLEDFWSEVNSIPNMHVSYYNPYYENEEIIIYFPELDYKFYENDRKAEDINVLIERLEKDKAYRTNLNPTKLKVLMLHSPAILDDPRIVKLIREFDVVMSGHMHRGLMFPIFNSLIKNNIGLVSPYSKPFPDNARGLKILKYENKEIPLIISGGITKLASGITRFGNIIYPMEMEEIKVHSKKLTK